MFKLKILALHCDYVYYEPVAKEIKIAEDIEKKPVKIYEVLLLLTSVESTDNDETLLNAINEINRVIKEIGAKKVLIYPYAHLSNNLKKPSEALVIIRKLHQELSKNVESYRAPFGWNKIFEIRVKGHPLAERLITV